MSANRGWEGWEGWEGWQSWRGWEGWEGWGGTTAAGVGSMLSDGLVRSRERLLPPPSRDGAASLPLHPVLPGPDDLKQFRCLSPEVRAKVLLADLIGGVQVKAGDEQSVTLSMAGASPRAIATLMRPPPTVFERQLELVSGWAAHRTERAPEILSQLGPQTAYWSAVTGLNPQAHPATLELCGVAMMFASFVIQRVKLVLSCPRPSAYDPTIQPMIPNPAFSVLPSGHATEAFMMARLLASIASHDRASATEQQLQRLAERIATNRVVAGVHFPVDGVAGRMLGESMAEYFRDRASGGGWVHRTFNGQARAVPNDPIGSALFTQQLQIGSDPLDAVLADLGTLAPYFQGNVKTLTTSESTLPLLADLWQRAGDEWT